MFADILELQYQELLSLLSLQSRYKTKSQSKSKK
jgi:hypothetical protein